MKDGLVSIVMPAYNSEKYIGETIESVLAQTYQNWELLIVDDCSTDNTPNIVRSYLAKDSRVKYYRLSQNLGAAAARNKAMYEATGEYMAFLDSDDLWYKEKLQKQTDFMNQEKINFSYTSYERIEECSNKLLQRVICPKQTSYEKLLLGNTIGNSTAMYSVKSLGKFNIPLIRKRNDYALWCLIRKKVRIGYKYKPKDLTLAEGCPARTYKNDFALHLFGCTNQNEAYKGKVSIEPAYFDKNTKKAEELTCILGTPHASDLAHYLCQPNIDMPKKNNARDLANYNSRESALRGRKFYWHRDPEQQGEILKNNVASLLKPIAKDSETKFIVHLDKVNITELGVILKVLSNKSGHALKLGAGKSVGFGSVQISISKTNIIDISEKYKSLKSRLNSLQALKDDQKKVKESEQNSLRIKAIKAFEDYANLENGIPFNEQKYIKELETMTNFAKKPRNALTQNMKLRDGAPNFSDKVVLLDPIDVVKGNTEKNN